MTDQQANHPILVRSKLAADLNLIAHRMQRDADEFGTARDAGDDEVEVAYNAIERARELGKLIYDALTLATHPTMPSDIAMEVRTCLHLLHETLGQPDVPARMELVEGRPDNAIDELHEAMMRGWEECGRQLNLLAAKLRASLSSIDQRAPTNASCGDRRYSIEELQDMACLSSAQLNRYAKRAGVRTPGRGKKNHTYTLAEIKAILKAVSDSPAANRDSKEACKAALETIGTPPGSNRH